MDRREFMTLLAASTAVAFGATDPVAHAADAPVFPTAPGVKVPILPGTLTWLPEPGNDIALTLDDGRNPDVVASVVQFARDTGLRFTFFVTAGYPSWGIHRDMIAPLVASGQIQLANHTWDHPDLVKLSPAAVADQLRRTQDFLRGTYGVDGTPYYRPPFGNHNEAVDRVAADLGYKIAVNWSGQLEDYPAGRTDETAIVDLARTHFKSRAIVLAHMNDLPITHVYGQLVEILRERALNPVTLADVLFPIG